VNVCKLDVDHLNMFIYYYLSISQGWSLCRLQNREMSLLVRLINLEIS